MFASCIVGHRRQEVNTVVRPQGNSSTIEQFFQSRRRQKVKGTKWRAELLFVTSLYWKCWKLIWSAQRMKILRTDRIIDHFPIITLYCAAHSILIFKVNPSVRSRTGFNRSEKPRSAEQEIVTATHWVFPLNNDMLILRKNAFHLPLTEGDIEEDKRQTFDNPFIAGRYSAKKNHMICERLIEQIHDRPRGGIV